jgi:uncharacterized membrane protein
MSLEMVMKVLLAITMVIAGAMHFIQPRFYLRMMPKILPAPLAIVYFSGVCEMVLGGALLVPALQRWAAWGLIALYVAVFPANLNMAVNDIRFEGLKHPAWTWVRLPFQAVFIAWAWWFTH